MEDGAGLTLTMYKILTKLSHFASSMCDDMYFCNLLLLYFIHLK